MYERIEKSNVSTHIYTLDGKLFTVSMTNLSLKFYDEDIDSDKMHDFTSKFINSLDIAYMDITSGVWEGGLMNLIRTTGCGVQYIIYHVLIKK